MNKTQEEIARKIRFFGGCLAAVGMADFAKTSLNNMLNEASEPPDIEEETIV